MLKQKTGIKRVFALFAKPEKNGTIWKKNSKNLNFEALPTEWILNETES